jgi:hypothetical protein
MTLTQEEAHRLFEYKDGALYWKEMVTTRTGNRVGKIAGSIHKHGYRIISVHGRQYKVHRLMFLYHHGYIPEFIDHINGIKDDNRIENLREATRTQNYQNRFVQKNNTFGVKGVSKQKNSPNWRCRISYGGRLHELAGFKSKELATEFMELWRDMAHGTFSNHGFKGALA